MWSLAQPLTTLRASRSLSSHHRTGALHLLAGDLGQLSSWRDGHGAGLLATDGGYRAFVAALDAKNQQWVDAGLPVPAGDYTTEGDDRLIAPLLTVRGIIV